MYKYFDIVYVWKGSEREDGLYSWGPLEGLTVDAT